MLNTRYSAVLEINGAGYRFQKPSQTLRRDFGGLLRVQTGFRSIVMGCYYWTTTSKVVLSTYLRYAAWNFVVACPELSQYGITQIQPIGTVMKVKCGKSTLKQRTGFIELAPFSRVEKAAYEVSSIPKPKTVEE
eukprot:sb/3474794/